jgi:flagellar motor switch protein FliN/FliY
MTAAPETAPTPASSAPEALTAAATAAAAVLPSPSALLLGPTDGSLRPTAEGSAVLASFTGATSGSLAIIVDPSLEAALGAADGGALSLAEAMAPALQAASAAIGPAVLSAAQVVPAQGLVAAGETAWAPLVGDGEVLVWVGLRLTPATGGSAPAAPRRTELGSLNLLRDVEMTLSVELGRTSMPVRDLLSLAPGSVIELDRAAGAPADLMVNGRLLARGEIVVVDEDYGLRITEIVDPSGEA